MLKNALTPGEQATLSNKKSYTPGGAAGGAGGGPASPAPAEAAAVAPGGRGRIQRSNTAILHATAGAKGGNPEGMLSSYDRELLAGGPESITAQSLSDVSAPAPAVAPPATARQAMLSQVAQPLGTQQYAYGQPYAYTPQYAQQPPQYAQQPPQYVHPQLAQYQQQQYPQQPAYSPVYYLHTHTHILCIYIYIYTCILYMF